MTAMKRKWSIVISLIGAAILIGGTVWFLASRAEPTDNSITTEVGYTTILPAGSSIEQLGGWKRVSPPEAEPVYAYNDTIDGTAVNVSQQPAPATLVITELAKQYNATTEVDANGTPIYIGTSSRGPQSVLFTKQGLLVLIKSQANINDASWASYVSSLR
jgi:hypothetical protein